MSDTLIRSSYQVQLERPQRCANTFRGLTRTVLHYQKGGAVMDSNPLLPGLSQEQAQLLDHMDTLRDMASSALDAGDYDTLSDALAESLAVEYRFQESRTRTWIAHASRAVGMERDR